jgi:ribosome-associated translation inhibitor RaiA
MRLTIRSRNLDLTTELRDHATRRMYFALSRWSPVLRRVDVTLADINGPKGGIDKVCRIRVRAPRIGELVVEERDADVTVAVDLAANRMARTVARALERLRLGVPRRLVPVS